MAKNSAVINVNNPEAPAVQVEQKTLKGLIQEMAPQFAKALPGVMTPARFTRIATTALTANPKLGECTPASFFGALLSAAQLGLEPNTSLQQAYLIPYGNQCQFQIGYRGYIALAHRSGDLKSIEAHVVYENDYFDYAYGLEPKLEHKPAMNNRGGAICVYAVYKLKSGGHGYEVMSVEDINRHRAQFSKAKNSPWDTNWEEMAKKTVVKKVLKYAPMSSEFVQGVANDSAVINFKDFDDKNEAQVERTFVDEDGVIMDVPANEVQFSSNDEDIPEALR